MEEGIGAAVMMVFFVLYFLFIGMMMLLALVSWVVTVLAVWDCARRHFPDPGTRALWCVLIVITRWLGALVYYIAVYRTDNPPLAPPCLAPTRR